MNHLVEWINFSPPPPPPPGQNTSDSARHEMPKNKNPENRLIKLLPWKKKFNKIQKFTFHDRRDFNKKKNLLVTAINQLTWMCGQVHPNETFQLDGRCTKVSTQPGLPALDFIHVAKYNEIFPKNRWKRRLFFLKSGKFAFFLLDSCFKFQRFFHRNHRKPRFFPRWFIKIGVWFFRNSGKFKIQVFSLTPINLKYKFL